MKKLIACLFTLPLLLVSCEDNNLDHLSEQETSVKKPDQLGFIKIDFDKTIFSKKKSVKTEDFANRVAILNESLLVHGIQLEKMELLGVEGAGNTVIFSNVGNKQSNSDFVPNDPRNWFPDGVTPGWEEGSIPYWTDGSEQGTSSGMNQDGTTYDGMTSNQTLSAIYSAMNKWDSISCSDGLRIWNVYTTTPGFNDGISTFGDVGFVQWLTGFGGFPGYAPGTILHGGNLPADFFEFVGGPGAGENTLGVTFTFTWGTDIDQNGKNDVGHREIYINRDFNWQDDPNDITGNSHVDYETVVLHEAGHGLSQGHFGKAIRSGGNNKVHFSPYALMNAGYSKAQREITATDNAGHCSIWEGWPNE